MYGGQPEVTYTELLSVSQRFTVFPIKSWSMVNFSSGDVIQLDGADYIVFIAVRLEDMLDF
jgi:hypothetical protein